MFLRLGEMLALVFRLGLTGDLPTEPERFSFVLKRRGRGERGAGSSTIELTPDDHAVAEWECSLREREPLWVLAVYVSWSPPTAANVAHSVERGGFPILHTV